MPTFSYGTDQEEMEPERTSDESYTQLLKILLLGDSASKKQILLKKFLGDETANDVTLLGEVTLSTCSK